MSNGLATLVANGATSIIVNRPGSHSIVVPTTVTSSGSYAWNSNAPLGTALVSDWPGRDYGSIASYKSNALSRYYSTPANPTAASFDTETYQGYPLLADNRGIGNLQTSLIIPSFSSKTDIVYHIRRKVTARGNANELVPSMLPGNYIGQDSGSVNVIAGLGFDYASHGQPSYPYGSPYNLVGGIILMITTNGGWPPRYALNASITNGSNTVLSDTTSRTGVFGPSIGDEFWNESLVDYFFRAYRVSNTLNIEAYYNYPNTAPVRIGVLALTMLDSSTPPMPKYGFNNWREGQFITPAVTKVAFNQIIDNVAYPNTALDFSSPIDAGSIGLGEHGASFVRRTVDLEQYANDAAFQADAYSGGNPPVGRYTAYGSLGTLQTTTDTPHNNKKFFRMSQPLNSFRQSAGIHDTPFFAYTKEIWWKESILFNSGWSNTGAGAAQATLAQNVIASGSPQTVNVNAGWSDGNNGNGLIGYGTANVEQVAYTHANMATTIIGVFTKNHSIGDEVSQAQGPGYKLWQMNGTLGGQVTDFRMEIVGNAIQTYLLEGFSTWDNAYPAFNDAGAGQSVTDVGVYRVVTINTSNATDFVSFPAGNAQGYSAYSATSGVGKELQFRGRGKIWFDADYGRYRCRLEHYIGVPGSPPDRYQMVEAFCLSGITGYITGMDYGENFNERVMADQHVDRWDQECCDPNVASVGSDPYGVVAALSLAVPNAATCGSATSPTTTTLTYPVTASASGSTVLQVIQEVFNGTVWIPRVAATTWTAGMGGVQNIVVTGLTTGTNYTGKIRFRMVSSYGMGPAVVCTNGTTS